MQPSRIDVAVIGGGPAGLYTATRLARAGVEVLLFEEHVEIGVPVHCTGIVSRDLFSQFDLPQDAVLHGLSTVRLRSPSGLSVEYTDASAEVVVLDRRRFDAALAQQARAAGVVLRSDERVLGVDVSTGGVRVLLATAGVVDARACVLACGARYQFQRRLGLGRPAHLLQSAQLELAAARPLDAVEVRFGAHVAPRGFAWGVPIQRETGPYVRVGLMAERNVLEFFRRLLNDVTTTWGLAASGTERPRLKVLPLAPIGRTYSDRVLAVGDAAGLVKPATGGGIYYSIVSADIAAGVLLEALRRNDLCQAALQTYEQAWRARLDAELVAQLSLRALAERLTDGEIDRLFELARADGILPLIRRTARFNLHRPFITALLRHEGARSILLGQLGT